MIKKFLFLALVLVSTISFSQKSEDGNSEVIVLNKSEIQDLPSQIQMYMHSLNTIHAGDAVEGDFLAEMKFTPNAEEMWVLNRTTNNITVIDWDSQEITHDIPVGQTPLGIDFSDDYAVVACFGSNEVYVINLGDYSVETIFTVSEGPAKVHVSDNGITAVVGCEPSDVAEVIDLTTLTNTRTIADFPLSVIAFAYITNNTRVLFYISNFRVTADGLYVINGANPDGLKFWNLDTGVISSTIVSAANSHTVEFSTDGTKLIALQGDLNGTVYQIDVSTQTLLTEVTATGETLQYNFSAPAVNLDGNKVLVPASGATNSVLFDMNAGTFQSVGTGNSPSWVKSNDLGDTFVAGSYFLTVIDASTGSVLDTSTGMAFTTGDVGANNRIIASAPMRYEGVLTRSFVNPSNIIEEGISPTGSELEADVCYYMKFTPNEEKLLSINNISGTVSVIDVETETLETIIPLNTYNISSCDITSDSNYAVVGKREENKIVVIDLQTNQVVAEVSSGGQGPSQIFVLPGDQYAYAVNGSGSDSIGVIALDGANSLYQSNFMIGNVGTSFTNKGIQSGLEFTEDGQFGLLASSFTDEVEIIDLNTHQVVSAISTPGFPLQIAISSPSTGSEFAGVTLKGTDGKLAILERSGSSWSLQGIYNCASQPVRVDYDIHTNSFWVTSSEDSKTQQFSLDSFSFIDEISYSPNLPIAVRNASLKNRRFTLVNTYNLNEPNDNKLFVSTDGVLESFVLPTLSSHNFDISESGIYAAVGHWGIDQISIFKDATAGIESFTIDMNANPYILYPNPVEEVLNFHSIANLNIDGNITIKLLDLNGKLIFEKNVGNQSNFSVKKPKLLPTGTYIYQLLIADKLIQTGKLINK